MEYGRRVEIAAIIVASIASVGASFVGWSTLQEIKTQSDNAERQLLQIEQQSKTLIDQTDALDRSVSTQEAASASDREMDEFEVKRFLIQSFSPRINAEPVETTFLLEEGAFVFSWKITNNGSNWVGYQNEFWYDLARCINQNYWNGSDWRSELSDDVTEIEGGLDLFEEGAGWTEIASGDTRTAEYVLDAPTASFGSLLPGEKIAIELFTVVYDPDQYQFRKQFENLNLRIGRPLSLLGRTLEFPAIVEVLGRTEMFQLQDDGIWERVPSDTECIGYLSDSSDD